MWQRSCLRHVSQSQPGRQSPYGETQHIWKLAQASKAAALLAAWFRVFSPDMIVLLGRTWEDGNGAELLLLSFLSPSRHLVSQTRERTLSQGRDCFYTQRSMIFLLCYVKFLLCYVKLSEFVTLVLTLLDRKHTDCLTKISSEHCEQVRVRTSSPGLSYPKRLNFI